MGKPVIDADACTECGICVDECPESCLEMDDIAVLVRPDDCTECNTCEEVCPSEAITME